jgi:hypothetical protein
VRHAGRGGGDVAGHELLSRDVAHDFAAAHYNIRLIR